MKNYEDNTDEQLIARLRSGESDITDFIMEKYKPLVRKKANAMYLIGGENDDLIQEGMIGLFKALRDYREDKECSFYHFAELCISRQLHSVIEASNRKKNQPLNTYISMSAETGEEGLVVDYLFTDEAKNPEQLVIEREYRNSFLRLLDESLSALERQVLGLYLEGDNYIQIAAKLEKPSKSIDNALQRIRQKIRVLDEKVGD